MGSRLVAGRNFCRCGIGRLLLTLTVKLHPTGLCGKASSTVTKFLFIANSKRILYCRHTFHRAFTSFLFRGDHLRGNSARGSGCNCLRHRGKICCFGLGLGVNLLGQWILSESGEGASSPARASKGPFFYTFPLERLFFIITMVFRRLYAFRQISITYN